MLYPLHDAGIVRIDAGKQGNRFKVAFSCAPQTFLIDAKSVRGRYRAMNRIYHAGIPFSIFQCPVHCIPAFLCPLQVILCMKPIYRSRLHFSNTTMPFFTFSRNFLFLGFCKSLWVKIWRESLLPYSAIT